MAAEGRRLALIVASSQFADPTLRQLITPGQDAADLARVLTDSAIGDFEVKVLIDQPAHDVQREIESFFAGRQRDDFLLVYFSTHGIKDDDGRLYLTTTDTDRSLLRTTTVPASFVNEIMTACRSRIQVLILDCCHSGAFARGMVAKGSNTVDVRDQFEGKGRVVLTASNATQYAFQGQEVVGKGTRSVFTRHLVRGLETGDADHDGDGWIGLDELYDYVYARVRDETPQQSPGKYDFDVQGDLQIARSRSGLRQPDDSELTQQYSLAMAALTAGQWEDALGRFDKIEAARPTYRDAAERARPLRELAAAMKQRDPSATAWRRAVSRFPVLAVMLATALPNVPASLFNFIYNEQAIVAVMSTRLNDAGALPNANKIFHMTAGIVNAVAFPIGLALLGWLALPVARGIARLRASLGVTTDELRSLRGRCLRLGHHGAAVGMSLWALAGPVYPVAIHASGGTMLPRDYTYFIASLALNGLIAAALAYFCVTFLSLGILYPLLVRPGKTTWDDADGLERLSGMAWRYLLLAVSVPLLAIALIVLDLFVRLLGGPADPSQLAGVLGALGLGALGALAGMGCAVWLFRGVHSDLAVLKQAVARSQPGVRSP